MTYTINQLAKVSGITTRALRFYDEVGLLKPAYVAENGYRYYQEKQLLMLQQILFFRELGFELKQIQIIMKQSNFDQLTALREQKKALRKNITRMTTLIKTIDKTIDHVEGKKTMSEKEMFKGLVPTQEEFRALGAQFQNTWESFVGKVTPTPMKPLPETTSTDSDWKEFLAKQTEIMENAPAEYRLPYKTGTPEFEASMKRIFELKKWGEYQNELFDKLEQLLLRGASTQDAHVQELIGKHYELNKSTAPSKENYIGFGNFYLDPAAAHTFAQRPEGFAQYLAQAMTVFAKQNLS